MHQCKAGGENFTKILNKSVHYGWAAKKSFDFEHF